MLKRNVRFVPSTEDLTTTTWKLLRSFGPRVVYFLLAALCFYYANFLMQILGDLIRGWGILVLISFMQVPLPEVEVYVGKVGTSVFGIFNAVFSIIRTLIEVAIALLQITIREKAD